MKDKMNLSRGRDRDRTARQVCARVIYNQLYFRFKKKAQKKRLSRHGTFRMCGQFVDDIPGTTALILFSRSITLFSEHVAATLNLINKNDL